MHAPTLDELAPDLEALVDATDGIDRFCSGPDWGISTDEAFAGDTVPLVLGDLTRWAAVLSTVASEDGRTVLLGPDAMWGFASPLLLPDPAVHAEELAAALADRSAVPRWDRLVLTGLDPGTPLVAHTARALSRFGPVHGVDGVSRCRADLADGVEAWLARRSRRFRGRLRTIRAGVDAAGVDVRWTGDGEGLLERLVAIERRSWKGARDEGLLVPELQRMYGRLIARLAARGRLRCAIATIDGEDVGFILGGVRAGTYRGLQLSYTTDVADLGIGHWLQWTQIAALEEEDVTTYDLGMDMPYKRRWADRTDPSLVVLVDRVA